jgi:hypothetical protein
MKLNLASACAVFALACAGSALADGTVTATLENPVAKPIKFIAAHAVFNCEETTCIAGIAPDDASDANACMDVAKQVGRIVSYKEFKPLDEKNLARCNRYVPAPKPMGTASR